MADKHTKGRLVYVTDGAPRPDIRAESGRSVAVTWMVCGSTPRTAAGYQARADEDRANARRIVACWNACEGLSTEALERLGTLDRARVQQDVDRARNVATVVRLQRENEQLAASVRELLELQVMGRVDIDSQMRANKALAEAGEPLVLMQRRDKRLAAMLAARPSVPQGEPVAHLWQHSETGRTRVVMPDQIITADASWRVVGPLYLAARPEAQTVALTEERSDCRACCGKGWIEEWKRVPGHYLGGEYFHIRCDECGGTGKEGGA